MGRIKIKGKTYNGNNISIINDEVYIDGNFVSKNKSTKVFVDGDIQNLQCEDAEINGNVLGDVDATHVNCEYVGGDVDATHVKCDNIGGDVDATHVNCEFIAGDVDATNVN